jgi:hypothetical protein
MIEYKIWLYGTSADKTSKTKKYVRISDKEISKAKGFHFFIKKSKRSKWQRITEDLELIPSDFKLKLDKEIYVQSFTDSVKEELGILEEEKEVSLPPLPEEPRVTLTKDQFDAQISRILYDELGAINKKWTNRRIDSFVDKLWKSYKHAPHLINSEAFRRGLVSKEIHDYANREALKKEKSLQEEFRKKLENKEVSLDPIVDAEVDVKFKEVFNFQRMKSKNDPTITERVGQDLIEKDRQNAFSQINVDYKEMIKLDRADILGSQSLADIAFSKVRKDITKLFDEAMRKGLFKPSNSPEYIIRLQVPLIKANGQIPESYLNRKNQRKSGYGFSTSRVIIRNEKDLKRTLDNLFNEMKPALAKYVKLNNSAGVLVSGFSIERLLRGSSTPKNRGKNEKSKKARKEK